MRIGLVVHPSRPQARQAAQYLSAAAARRSIEVVPVSGGDAKAPEVDVLMAVGGDGTVLETAQHALRASVPLLGVNLGRMGFLAECEPSGMDAALDALAAGRWEESARTTVQAVLEGESFVGVNDVVLEKEWSPRIISLAVTIDGVAFPTYHADAVIVATPTGSTAYSFSAGGPLLDPELRALILTAVAPHSLFNRPVVFGGEVRMELTPIDDRPAGLNVDGRQVAKVDPGQTVEVSTGPQPVRFIKLSARSFSETITSKFGLHSHP